MPEVLCCRECDSPLTVTSEGPYCTECSEVVHPGGSYTRPASLRNPCLRPGPVNEWSGNRFTHPSGDIVFIDHFNGRFRWEIHGVGARGCTVSQQFVDDRAEAQRRGLEALASRNA